MIKTVVKWSYIKGPKGLQRAKAHINYVQYRDGLDRAEGPRKFYDANSNQILGTQIKQRLEELEQRGVQLHKFILSPGMNSVDLDAFTRELMGKLARSKGLDLEWYAVNHDNTAHQHAHISIMGVDQNGRQVQFQLQDHKQLRQWGDRYLEREHLLERYLDGELSRLMEHPSSDHELQYKRGKGDKQFERWMYGRKRDGHDEDAERDHREWELFDSGLTTAHVEQSANRPLSYRQHQRQSAGRLSDFHEIYQGQELEKYWQNVADEIPGLAGDALTELDWLQNLKQERRDICRNTELDTLIDGRNQTERFLKQSIEEELVRENIQLQDTDRTDFDWNDNVDPQHPWLNELLQKHLFKAFGLENSKTKSVDDDKEPERSVNDRDQDDHSR